MALNSSACDRHRGISVLPMLPVPSAPMRKATLAASPQGLADRSASHSTGSSCSATSKSLPSTGSVAREAVPQKCVYRLHVGRFPTCTNSHAVAYHRAKIPQKNDRIVEELSVEPVPRHTAPHDRSAKCEFHPVACRSRSLSVRFHCKHPSALS